MQQLELYQLELGMNHITQSLSHHHGKKLEAEARLESRRRTDGLPAMNGDLLLTDPWRIADEHILDRIDTSAGAGTALDQAAEQALGDFRISTSMGSLPEHVHAFQSLLFGDSGSTETQRDSHGSSNSVTKSELISRIQSTDSESYDALSDSTSAHGKVASGEKLDFLKTDADSELSEFQIEAPSYGRIRVAVKKHGDDWLVELKPSTLLQHEGLVKFASVIETALRKKIGAKITLKVL